MCLKCGKRYPTIGSRDLCECRAAKKATIEEKVVVKDELQKEKNTFTKTQIKEYKAMLKVRGVSFNSKTSDEEIYNLYKKGK